MDFPKSVPSIGLVDGKFIDEDSLAGTPGSLIPSVWGNSITLEVLNVIEAAGLAPSELDLTQLLQAIRLIGQSGAGNFGADTGAANVYAVAYTPAIPALVNGLRLRFKAKTANTASSTFSPNGVVAKPLVGLGLSALQGGEIVANGLCSVVYSATLDQWILLESTGGATPVTAASKSQHAVQLGQVGHGQCKVGIVDPTHIGLSPYNGQNLIINGVPCKVPVPNPQLSNASTVANTFYYIYAFMNAGVMMLEASTTTHVPHTDGVEIKSGDPTRTLVAALYANAANQFVRSQSYVGLINWFNRASLGLAQSATTSTFSSAAMAEITQTDRVSFINWQDESVKVAITGTMNLGSAATVQFNVYVNGLINRLSNGGATNVTGANIPCGHPGNISVNEGQLNYTTVFASTTAGTVTAAFTNFVDMRG